MNSKDFVLLEKAYLSIAQKMPSVPSDEESVSIEPNEMTSTGPVDEPAPNTDTLMTSPEEEMPPSMEDSGISPAIGGLEDDRLDVEDENEEDTMVIDNLNSIRESIMKIAKHCASGGHVEPWQQEKLAICMDNLAEIARRIRC